MKLEGPASSTGYYVGFTVGNDDLLDATVLSGVRLHTFLSGVLQETTGAGLLRLNAMPGGQTRADLLATKPFDAVSIARTSTASVFSNV